MVTAIGSLSGSITFSGISSGTDFSSIIDQLMELERYQITRMESWQADWEEKITSIQGLNTRVLSLYNYSKNFNQDFEFYARTSASSNTSVLTTTNTPTAKPGAHTVTVAGATQERYASKGFSATTAVVGGSAGETLTFQVGSSVLSLAYGSNYAAGEWDVSATLSDLALAINAADDALSNVLASAEIINDGSDQNAFRLVLTTTWGGASQAISVAGDPTNLALDGRVTVDDQVELSSSWAGTAAISPASLSAYQGFTNKRFSFYVNQGGPVSGADIQINWSDTEGNYGSFSASAVGSYAVYQGLALDVGSGMLATGDSFYLDVFNPVLQAAQDDGLAKVDQVTHAGFMDTNTTPVTTALGSFTYRVAGVSRTLDVPAGTTLQGLVNLINSDSGNPGVTASILNDGQGLATSYHLVLTSKKSGQAYQIEVDPSTSLDNFSLDFTTTQRAQNAMVKVDGYPPQSNQYIQRTTNTISDIIAGVTLRLVSSGTATVTVDSDKSTIAQRISDFVTSVNFVLEYIHEQTKYDEDTGETGIMIGNYAFQIVQSKLKGIMSSRVPDLTDGVDRYVTLAQIGITSDPDNYGYYTIDSTVLDEALNTDLDAVARLFILDGEHGTSGVAELMRAETARLTDASYGPMNVLVRNYQGIIDNIDKKIDDEERRVTLVESRLRDQFARLEAVLGELEQQQSYLEQQISSLSSSSKK